MLNFYIAYDIISTSTEQNADNFQEIKTFLYKNFKKSKVWIYPDIFLDEELFESFYENCENNLNSNLKSKELGINKNYINSNLYIDLNNDIFLSSSSNFKISNLKNTKHLSSIFFSDYNIKINSVFTDYISNNETLNKYDCLFDFFEDVVYSKELFLFLKKKKEV
jgi:hypothetical protein